MGFWSALGAGLENYGKQRLAKSRLGGVMQPRQPGMNIPMGQEPAADNGSGLTPYSQDQSANQNWGGIDAFAGGKIVTKPTTAIVGEKGPEAIVPLSAAPGQKLSPAMLGATQGTKSRWRAVSGPNALKNTAPIKSDIPLRPNRFMR